MEGLGGSESRQRGFRKPIDPPPLGGPGDLVTGP